MSEIELDKLMDKNINKIARLADLNFENIKNKEIDKITEKFFALEISIQLTILDSLNDNFSIKDLYEAIAKITKKEKFELEKKDKEIKRIEGIISKLETTWLRKNDLAYYTLNEDLKEKEREEIKLIEKKLNYFIDLLKQKRGEK